MIGYSRPPRWRTCFAERKVVQNAQSYTTNSAAIYKKFTKPCGLDDDECKELIFNSVSQEAADVGIPEFDIPKLDPYEVKDLSFLALGMVKVTMKDGAVAGFKSCKTHSFTTDAKTLHTNVELVCDSFTYEGHYKAEPTPTLLALLGGIQIHGEGKANVVVEKLKLNLDFPFEVKKLDDGELHFNLISADAKSTFEVLGKIIIDGDGIFIGKQDVSTVAVNILNENSEFVTKTLGPSIIEGGLQIFYSQVKKFFDAVPTKKLIVDDLSSFVKN